MDELPLRERSKIRRRAAIQKAAMRLFIERGFDATTVVEIAAAAEVAPRSISAYFPSKLDIALSSSNASSARFLAAIQTKDPLEPFVQTFTGWLARELEIIDDEEWRLRAAMFAANPSLAAGGSALTAELVQSATSALAVELQVTPDDPAATVCLGLFAGTMLQFLSLPERADVATALETARIALDGAMESVARRP